MNKSQLSQLQNHQNPQIIPQKPTNNNNNNVLQQHNKTPNNSNLTNTMSNDNNNNNNNKKSNRKIWDCGSTLYDSFELDSFRKQLDSAIVNSSRTLSMPRLPSEHQRAPSSQPQVPTKKPSKLSRTFQKLLRSVFRVSSQDKNKTTQGSASPDPWFFDSPVSYEDKSNNDKIVENGVKYYVVYDKTSDMNGLSSIPEVTEVNVSPEFGSSSSLVRKTMSERFTTAASLGIHCS